MDNAPMNNNQSDYSQNQYEGTDANYGMVRNSDDKRDTA